MRTIVVVGAGFAGTHAAQTLATELSDRRGIRLRVISAQSHFLFTPLWTSVALAASPLSQAAVPVRKLLPASVELSIDEVRCVDHERRVLVGEHAEHDYDYLIVTAGVDNDWGQQTSALQFARPCRSGRDAVDARDAVEAALRAAKQTADPADARRLSTFVVVGGGPNGVEAAATIADLVSEFDPGGAGRVMLVERESRLLPEQDVDILDRVMPHLDAMGVQVRLGDAVVSVGEDRVELASRDAIGCGATFWCAGVRGVPLFEASSVQTDERSLAIVHQNLQVVGKPGFYVAGDAAAPPSGAMMSASTAVEQAHTAAHNVIAEMAGRSRRPWAPAPQGFGITLGRTNAVAMTRGGTLLSGRGARAVMAAASATLLPRATRSIALLPELLSDAFGPRTPSSEIRRLLKE